MTPLLFAQSFTPSTTSVAGNVFLTAIVGLLPLILFFVLMGVFKVATHWCAIISLVTSLVIAVLAFKMPVGMALLAGTQGAAMGFMPIIYIIIAAVWLYNLTEKSGRSSDLKAVFNTIGRGDQRAQALLVAWCFCGLLEGLAGFGAPVAITCAMLVTLGVPKIKAAVVTVVGNAINVGFGAMAIPTTTAGKLGGADPVVVAGDMGHLTWIFCLFIPMLMLFILGLFIVKGPMKWALLAATVLSILLSWGKNFMGLTDFFIDYVPMYAKFRTVASILVIAEFTIPLLAMLALKQIVDEPDLLRSKMKYLYVSFGLTAGMALLFALMPGVFFSDFISTDEMRALSQFPSEQLTPILTNLRTVRQAIFAADCWRTFWIIVIGTALLLLFTTKRLKAPYAIAAITLLCLVDMWQVNKRYLNDDMFVESTVRDTPQPLTPTDRQILQDKALDYRVLNLASNTFNENETSYYHKSIGGYHAAKLRRYQELIEAYISPEMQRLMPALVKAGGDMTRVNGDSLYPVLNMLNTKYFILPLQNNQTVPLQNPYAFGNAWMIDRISYVDNANAELDALAHIDLKHEAVADKRFQSVLGQSQPQGNVAKAVLTKYAPDQLTYSLETDKGGILVFSEVYYPEWTATVDGHPVEVGRVNYLLRAIHVKPGRHEVVLSFFPQSVQRTELVAYIAYALLVLLTIGLIFWNRKSKKGERV